MPNSFNFKYFCLSNTITNTHWYFEIDIPSVEVENMLDDDSDEGFLTLVMESEEFGVLDLNSSGSILKYCSYEVDEVYFPAMMSVFRQWFLDHGYEAQDVQCVNQQQAILLGLEDSSV